VTCVPFSWLVNLSWLRLLVATCCDCEPRHAADYVGEIHVWEPVVGAVRYGVERAREREKHRRCCCDGDEQRHFREGVVALEVDRERDRGEAIGGDEAIDGERAHPTVDICSGYAS